MNNEGFSFGHVGGLFTSAKKSVSSYLSDARGSNSASADSTPISAPSNFRHVSHVGWDPANGFDVNNIPAEWQKLFKKAKVTKADLKNPETSKFILETVVASHGSAPGKQQSYSVCTIICVCLIVLWQIVKVGSAQLLTVFEI